MSTVSKLKKLLNTKTGYESHASTLSEALGEYDALSDCMTPLVLQWTISDEIVNTATGKKLSIEAITDLTKKCRCVIKGGDGMIYYPVGEYFDRGYESLRFSNVLVSSDGVILHGLEITGRIGEDTYSVESFVGDLPFGH